MSAFLVLADAVRDELNATEFSQSFTAERRLRPPQWTAGDSQLESLQVVVVPSPTDIIAEEREDRSHWREALTIDIGVHRTITTDDEVEALLDLCQEIRRHFSSSLSGGGATYDLVERSSPVLMDYEHHAHNTFTHVIRLVFETSVGV